MTWSRTTSLLPPLTPLLSSVVLLQWSSTPVCQTWRSWDTERKTSLHTNVMFLLQVTIQSVEPQPLYDHHQCFNTARPIIFMMCDFFYVNEQLQSEFIKLNVNIWCTILLKNSRLCYQTCYLVFCIGCSLPVFNLLRRELLFDIHFEFLWAIWHQYDQISN